MRLNKYIKGWSKTNFSPGLSSFSYGTKQGWKILSNFFTKWVHGKCIILSILLPRNHIYLFVMSQNVCLPGLFFKVFHWSKSRKAQMLLALVKTLLCHLWVKNKINGEEKNFVSRLDFMWPIFMFCIHLALYLIL